MTKKQKIEYIINVNDKFINARNHGNQGNNWWYPKANIMAYNVKMHESGFDVEDARKLMSKIQNDFYSNDRELQDEMQYHYDNQLEQSCIDLINDIKDISCNIKDVGFSGRSGGWCEVEYINNLDYYTLEELEKEHIIEVNAIYKDAKELEELEIKVSEYIKDAHKELNKYIASDDYINYFVYDFLKVDDEIIRDFTDEILGLQNKLRSYAIA